MLDILLESRRVRARRPLVEAALSAGAHVAIAAALIAGHRMTLEDAARRRQLQSEQIVPAEYVVPPDKAGTPHEEHVEFMATSARGAHDDKGDEAPTDAKESSLATRSEQSVVQRDRAALVDDAYSVLDVDSAAVRDPTSAAPSYPPVMMSLNIEGAATIRFVVDTTGLVDLGTVRTVTATNPAFAHAVLEALPKMKFRPARMGALPVRQASLEEFKFQLKHPAGAKP